MNNIPVYFVVNLKINDSEEYRIYMKKGSFHFLRNIMVHLLHSMIHQNVLKETNLNSLIES